MTARLKFAAADSGGAPTAPAPDRAPGAAGLPDARAAPETRAPAPTPGYGYFARTIHTRISPVRRRFAYRLFCLYLDIDHAGDAQTRLLSHNRWNVFSFHDCDHGDRSGAPLRPWCERAFASANANLQGGAIYLLTFPRMFGHVFNPLSVYYGFDRDGALRGLIYEVNNTYGETHAYVFALDGHERTARHEAPKRFHVSPFLDVAGIYRFAATAPGAHFALRVENWREDALEHSAAFEGRRVALTDWRLLAVLLGLPLMTLGVVLAIHWQALRVWLAGVGYRRKPAPPKTPFTSERARPSSPLSPAPEVL